ncbi:endonuclease/exonuclease/phosphatase family protein [Streptomyces sp. AV19]|uniref:endonuclease/exonuclease/phosphatase family protein n=1 Tax=Streptomyces sp. AV19 TaxID=2793068 RepID=UPI0018FEF198|nr:endonuclease/exonuclease/phosphatase family protein [Streptomyces sp. AV19]MBH1933463.1 endonuclease/exonuclease/phosphatase family protein [Streptomyces sp. AV19]MDG4532112.1 endonuclease/exonuclease/phosphatase family protein [Streptomyces sp. AV19]
MPQAHVQETGHGGAGPERTGSGARRLADRWRGPGIWRRGLVIAILAVVLGLLMLLHGQIPNRVGNLGSLAETFLPWFGLLVPVLLVLALWRRSATALIAVVLPAIAWLNLFGGLLTDKSGSGGNFTVISHNVNAENPDPAATARSVAAAGADVVALEELKPEAAPVYERTLAASYPYHSVQGTVGIWSKHPITDARPVDIKMGWTRALRATVGTPQGPVGVYVAHLPSVRVKFNAGFTAGQRDNSAAALGRAIAGEQLKKVVLLGDLNGTMNDRSLAPVTSQLRSAQGAAGDGFGFSWPASLPMARIDQIMVRGMDPVEAWTLPDTGSDHLPVAARVKL